MSTTAQQVPTLAQPPMPNSFRLIATLGGIATISGLLVVMAYQMTLAPIAANKRAMVERAIFQVVPGATARSTYLISDTGLEHLEDPTLPGDKVYAAFDDNGVLLGVALEGAAQGYQDVIRALYGYSFEKNAIIGFTVLESKETPGLGDKIAKDPDFLANFTQLDAALNESGDGLLHAIEVTKEGTKTDNWQIDGITGATISSNAVGKLMNESAQQLIPFVRQHRDQLRLDH
jgi:electron transport complex protein RnfG